MDNNEKYIKCPDCKKNVLSCNCLGNYEYVLYLLIRMFKNAIDREIWFPFLTIHRGRTMATKKQMYERLVVINQENQGSVSSIHKTVRSISYYQNHIKRDVREIRQACTDRRFGCGSNK